MSKKLLTIFLMILCAIIIVACGSTNTTSSSSSSVGTGNEVHMNGTSFTQASITIKKGQSVTLVDDDALTPHIIANGTWENNTAKPAKEAGAPEVSNVQIGGNSSQAIGPFNTSGTFHLYCTIHPGMQLTVIVQ